jgi:hypothetical protein
MCLPCGFYTFSKKSIRCQKTIKPKGKYGASVHTAAEVNLQQLNQNISSLARNPKLAQFEENKCRLLSDSEWLRKLQGEHTDVSNDISNMQL